MTGIGEKPQSESSEKKGIRALSQSEFAMPLFIFSGFAAAYVSAMTAVAAAYNSRGHTFSHFLSYYLLGLLILPCFLIAILRRRWASIPLWVCCILMIVRGFFHTAATTSGIGALQPGIGIFLTPALVEIARFLRARQSKT